MESCLTCSEPTKKYRCSKCTKFCCSLKCYKEHKENDVCSNIISDSEKGEEIFSIDAEGEQNQRLQMFNTEDTVEPSKLQELENCPRILELLQNPHLRQYIAELDKTPDAWKAMKVAMLEPLFVEFANECMNVIEPDDSTNALPLSPTEEVVQSLHAAIIEHMDG